MTFNQKTVRQHFPGAPITGDGEWVVVSDCGLFQTAYLFADQIQRDTAMFRCGPNCRGKNFHKARQTQQPVVEQPSKPFRVPGDWEP